MLAKSLTKSCNNLYILIVHGIYEYYGRTLTGACVKKCVKKNRIKGIEKLPLRVDFAGGWLDVPDFQIEGGHIVNCTIDQMMERGENEFRGGGLGWSAANSILNGQTGVRSELDKGVGWQDPAVIWETGLCVWESGNDPKLILKMRGDILQGKMGLHHTGARHVTSDLIDKKRDYDTIKLAGNMAKKAIIDNDYNYLVEAVRVSYEAQIQEGMNELPNFGQMAKKYCGSGHGGYALYLFKNKYWRDNFVEGRHGIGIEPFIKDVGIKA